MYTNNSAKKEHVTIIVFLLAIFFFSFTSSSEAAGSFGWFAPKVEYVKDNVASVCPGEASIEFSLVEKNTQSLITNSVSIWTVTRRKNDVPLTILESKSFTTEKTSSVICFDPVTDGFQIKVLNSENYWGFNGPTILPTGIAADLNSMIGKHFKGYLQLESKSNTVPFVNSISPNTGFYSVTPTFQVETNSLTTLYGTSQVKSTKIFAVNQAAPNTFYRATAPTTGGAVPRTIIAPTLIPAAEEGIFFWSFIQDLNGVSVTKKLTSPARVWTFSSIPTSGSPDVMSFTIDKSDPTSSVAPFISSVSPLTLSVQNDVTDTYSGLASTTIIIESGTGLFIASAQKLFASGVNSSKNIFDFTGSDIAKGKTYNIYAVTVDNLGNTITSNVVTYTIPATLNLPTVTNLDYETTAIPFQYKLKADVAINGSNVTDWGTCWTTTNLPSPDSFFTSPDVNCKNNTAPDKNLDFSFFDLHNSLPNGTTIYYIAYAKNIAGRGVSSIKTIVIPISAQILPVVQYVSPTIIQSNTLNPGVTILSTGNVPKIEGHGICYFTNELTRNSFDGSLFPSPNTSTTGCYTWNILPPYSPYAYRNTFTNLLPSTKYFFKVFASTTVGYGFDVGSSTTKSKEFYFKHWVNNSPKFIIDSTKFNEITNQYDEIGVRVAIIDASSELEPLGARRDVSFTAKLDVGSDSTIDFTNTDTVEAHFPSEAYNNTFSKIVKFFNVPLGPVSVIVKVNDPENPAWPQTDPDGREVTIGTTLKNPIFSLDDISGDETSIGADLIVDPLLTITASPLLIRSGQTTTIKYGMENVNGLLKCSIYGPSNFDTDGVYEFEHNFIDGLLTRIEDDVITEPMFNTQVFKFECIDKAPDPDVPYATTTRVTVVGNSMEI